MSKPEINTIFFFLRYIQPIWYLNLRSPSLDSSWVDYRKLSSADRKLLSVDEQYKSIDASLRDAAYQAWQKGIMVTEKNLGLPQPFSRLPIRDEYRFIKKYFNPIWSWYVLGLRLFLLRNPIKEFHGFLSAFNVKRMALYQSTKKREAYSMFASGLIERNPKVSVVIPTLNRYEYLKDVLHDLEKQEYKNIEVIVVDQTDSFRQEFYEGWKLDLRVVNQQEKALWKARNRAIEMAVSEIILLYDDDSRVEPNWISEHLKCLDFYNADFSAGVSLSMVGAKIPFNYSFFRWADQFDTGNAMVKKSVFRKVGLFDRQFEKQRMGDGEFGLRAYLSGCIGISNPNAKRIHLKVASGGLRQMGSWDGFRPTNWFAPRPIPSVLYLTRRYFGNTLSIFDLLVKAPSSILPLRFKRKPILLLLASIASIFILPLVLCQVFLSWRKASKMIEEGPKISNL